METMSTKPARITHIATRYGRYEDAHAGIILWESLTGPFDSAEEALEYFARWLLIAYTEDAPSGFAPYDDYESFYTWFFDLTNRPAHTFPDAFTGIFGVFYWDKWPAEDSVVIVSEESTYTPLALWERMERQAIAVGLDGPNN